MIRTYNPLALTTAESNTFAPNDGLISSRKLSQVLCQCTGVNNRLIPLLIKLRNSDDALADGLVHMPGGLIAVRHVQGCHFDDASHRGDFAQESLQKRRLAAPDGTDEHSELSARNSKSYRLEERLLLRVPAEAAVANGNGVVTRVRVVDILEWEGESRLGAANSGPMCCDASSVDAVGNIQAVRTVRKLDKVVWRFTRSATRILADSLVQEFLDASETADRPEEGHECHDEGLKGLRKEGKKRQRCEDSVKVKGRIITIFLGEDSVNSEGHDGTKDLGDIRYRRVSRVRMMTRSETYRIPCSRSTASETFSICSSHLSEGSVDS